MNDLVHQLIEVATVALADYEIAYKGIRSLCSYYGGQLIYIPRFQTTESKHYEAIRGVLADAVGDGDAEKILAAIMDSVGGALNYIPKEKTAFKKAIAQEIESQFDGTWERTNDLCRKYDVSFNYIYSAVHQARDDRLQNQFDF